MSAIREQKHDLPNRSLVALNVLPLISAVINKLYFDLQTKVPIFLFANCKNMFWILTTNPLIFIQNSQKSYLWNCVLYSLVIHDEVFLSLEKFQTVNWYNCQLKSPMNVLLNTPKVQILIKKCFVSFLVICEFASLFTLLKSFFGFRNTKKNLLQMSVEQGGGNQISKFTF